MPNHPTPSDLNALTVAAQYLSAKGFHPTLGKEYCFELLNARHSADVVRWRNDPENTMLFLQVKRLTPEDQANFLENYEARQRVDFVLVTERERTPVGTFTLKNLDTSPELGKLLEKSYRGKGLASSATLALLHFGFEWLRLPIIWANTQKTNEVNIHINTKLGFTIESEFERDGAAYWRMCLSREVFGTKAR